MKMRGAKQDPAADQTPVFFRLNNPHSNYRPEPIADADATRWLAANDTPAGYFAHAATGLVMGIRRHY